MSDNDQLPHKNTWLIRTADTDDLIDIRELVRDTIQHVCQNDYNAEQIQAWLAGLNADQRWIEMMKDQAVYVAMLANKIVGFCSLKAETYIDFFYVHKSYQGKGIATTLLRQLEHAAHGNNTNKLTALVSITAKPFFLNKDFVIVKKQQVIRNDIALTNFEMLKHHVKK